jgi:hypothetical protein
MYLELDWRLPNPVIQLLTDIACRLRYPLCVNHFGLAF